MKRIEAIERTFSNSKFDFIFPWHMYLGGKEDGEEVYTPFKTFNRRRNYLVWLFNDKYDHLFTEEEKQRRNKAEKIVF